MLRDELLRRFPRLKDLPPQTYVVGGAIRDLLLGIEPADVDIACDDPQLCAQSIGSRVIRLGTGEHLSAWRVVDGAHIYDFAETLDHDIDADLARRDFTVNAMAIPLAGGELLDRHDGQGDLKRRVVRMISAENFDDDPLRCLKAVRMAIKYRFEIDPATLDAIRPRAALINRVAAERVTFELSIIFSSGQLRRAIELLHATALDVPLFGRELPRVQSDDVSLSGSYALLVSDPKKHAKRWKWSTDLLREVSGLQHLLAMNGDLRVALYDAGELVARQLPGVLRALGRDDKVAMPDFSIRSLLSGDEMGLPEGPELGRRKRALLEAQIRGEVKTREEARKFVKV
jgi:tRNA nucleotidyltransferase/poly(A) polymerase